ncbi:MAG: T9SS type A sorting domain-containing protein [Ignavibacteriales bacterium]|nr:MAG: T9SS type A sorting domain-containing protein [Ignavibacteriales bacterium]
MCLELKDGQSGFLSHNTLGSAQFSKTTDGGLTWTQPYWSNTRFIQSIDFLNNSLGYAVGFKIQVPPNPNLDFVMITTNGGVNWYEQYLNTGVLNSVFFINENLGWAVGDDGKIIHTVNGGTPVELISFTAKLVNDKILIDWSTASELNNQGFEIERSTNKTDWIRIGFREGKGTTTEQQNYSFTDDINGINVPKLFYRLKQIDFDRSYKYSDIVEVIIAPIKFSLSQNYPNPFNPSTKISWQSPVGSHQTLKVYDVLGKEVATLVNEYRNAGSFEVEFDASQLASGVYYYQLRVGDLPDGKAGFVETRKMILIK